MTNRQMKTFPHTEEGPYTRNVCFFNRKHLVKTKVKYTLSILQGYVLSYGTLKLSQNLSCQIGPPYRSKFALPMSPTRACCRFKENE